MKLSKDTLNILKNFSTINSGIMLKQGNFIMTRAVNGTTYAEATIADTIDFEVAIYDLNGFLGILGLVNEDAEISMADDGNVKIADARSTIFWPAADPSTIVFPSKPIPFPVASVIVDFKGEDLQQLMRVSRGLQIDTITFTNKDGKIILNGYNKVEDSALVRVKYSLTLGDYDGTNNFNFVINMANMKMQPASYKLMLWADGKKTAAKFEGEHASYVVAMEADSTHDF
ncbi:sliding clamp [Salmonella phage vB_SenM-AKM_NP4]|uniref:Sliding clamp n=4 Tax=Gelderlandvirus TaxID=1913653 RepID=M1EAL6_BPS16|nr:DNA polymerase processivity factor [Salmonella phage vB_SenM-S16]YP_009148038.1 DNA polymerase processivity factor [Salmonella phage STML-198]YP_009286410.1 DNA polymerase processivity factor [Salmonella phage vB_SnwM_CGG4-1]YP_009615529.1 DNA polymerase processivity factor [Salmonella phage Melville]WDR21714.1 sliding clamp DNA polymerase accessory protein [Salmonella phage vB_SenM_UTK0003]WKV23396.1 DNA polymerase clamp [Salmonella phage SEA1]WLI71673.1 sliding clamp [Salmonella phage vB